MSELPTLNGGLAIHTRDYVFLTDRLIEFDFFQPISLKS